MKTDINNRQDIQTLVDNFYSQVINDPILGDFFTTVAEINWDNHLPQMYDFWESILFSKSIYTGNPLKKHKELNQKKALEITHFEHWIKIFNATVDCLFAGKNATRIKKYAAVIQQNLATRTINKT